MPAANNRIQPSDGPDPSENPAVVMADYLSPLNPKWDPEAWERLKAWECFCEAPVQIVGEAPRT